MSSKEQKRPKIVGIIVIVVVIIVGIFFLVRWLTGYNTISTDTASISCLQSSISSRIMGRIVKLYVDEGSKVEANQLLVQLEDTDLRAQELQAKAALENTKLNVNLAKINLEKTKNDFDRIKGVYDAGNSTLEQYDHASKALASANVQYSISQAQIKTAEAQLEIIESQLLNTIILAPISGIIAKRGYAIGEIVQPGMEIFKINDLSNVWVTANLKETDVRKIHPEQKVDITVDAYPGMNFIGRVAYISAAIVPPAFQIGESTKTTQKVPVKILFDKIPQSVVLQPGFSVTVSIKVK